MTQVAERPGVATMRGNPITLLGPEIRPGQPAPNFTAVDTALQPRTLQEFRGKVVVLASVPSLDTAVCATETKRFNRLATQLGEDVVILVISMDLPFAQKRWCGAEGVDRVITLSDHRDADFGLKYGVLIKGLRLDHRAVFVVDRQGIVRYVQYVPEVTQEPDYDAVLEAVRKVTQAG